MIVVADFVPAPRVASVSSLAFGPRNRNMLAAHVRLLSDMRADALDGGSLVERGIVKCPCEIDVDLSRLFERAGASYAFDFLFEPLGDADLTTDVELHRLVDGRWVKQRIISGCQPGILRSAPVQPSFEKRLRLMMRVTSDTNSSVRVSMREPLRGRALVEQSAEGAP